MVTAIAITLAGISGAGCSPGSSGAPSSGPVDQPSPSPSTQTSSSASTTTSSLSAMKLGLERVAGGFEQPLLVVDSGDESGRLFVVEQTGRIRVIRDGKVSSGAFLNLSSKVSAGGERGLLGLAFAPDFATSGALYVDYTDVDGNTVVERFVVGDPASDTPPIKWSQRLLHIAQPYPNHNGGCITFAPDGTLWVGMGDGGSAGDPQNRAQNPKSPLGKVLSLDVSVPDPKPRVVITGVRNPWRFSFDRETGDLWLADVGQDKWEEIDYLPAGHYHGVNLGWNRWEGTHVYPPGSHQARDGYVFPVAEYSHSQGESITGGYVYRGSKYPALRGAYLYADYVSGWVAALRLAKSGSHRVAQNEVMIRDAGNPSSFGQDAAGELYLVDYLGSVYRIVVR